MLEVGCWARVKRNSAGTSELCMRDSINDGFEHDLMNEQYLELPLPDTPNNCWTAFGTQ